MNNECEMFVDEILQFFQYFLLQSNFVHYFVHYFVRINFARKFARLLNGCGQLLTICMDIP